MPVIPTITPEEVAKLFGVTEYTVRTWIGSANGMRAIRVGRRLFVPQDEVNRYYKERFGHETKKD